PRDHLGEARGAKDDVGQSDRRDASPTRCELVVAVFHRNLLYAMNAASAGSSITRFSITPTFSISIRTTSPGTRNFPAAAPTPAGVPVETTSPGSSVKAVDSVAT